MLRKMNGLFFGVPMIGHLIIIPLEISPKGLNTLVGERGVKLSGGQIQRIGIARAIYNKSSVLILDEATSSLDTKTEKNFLKFISELKEFKLKIIVTHRKESLVICNEIFEMKLGALKRVI